MTYDNKSYWRSLHSAGGLRAVGQSALPEHINAWIYRTIRRNLKRFAQRHDLVSSDGARMLEVGVGSGYWVDFWQELGWQVDGCDLVPAAVEQLRLDHPDARFWAADASSPEGILAQSGGLAAESYDLVTATSVLLHVTEDASFAQALVNVAAAVKPGGHLLLVEPVLTIVKKQAPYDPARTSRARVMRSYRRPLRELGLEFVAVAPTTVLAANPLEATSPAKLRRYHQWWKLVAAARQKPATAYAVGPLMYALDGVLMRTKEAPTSKILLFRRPV